MRALKMLIELLTKREQKRFALLLCMILIMAIFDMLGVASIMPFMAILANPGLIESNFFLNNLYVSLNFSDKQQFMFVSGLCVFSLLVLSLLFKALTIYAQIRFSMLQEYYIGRRLLRCYLYRPYSWFLNRHSSDLDKVILSEVSQVISSSLLPMMNLITQSAVTVALLTLLIIVDPMLAFFSSLTLGCTYAIIFKFTNRYLHRIGLERVRANQERFTALSEGFGAIKAMKLGGLEEVYIKRFSEPAQTYARHISTAQIIGQLPRFALEGIAFGGMLLVVLYLMAKSGNFSESLPIIALYALAGYRLMPALQQIYNAVTLIRFSGPGLKGLHFDLLSFTPSFLEASKTTIPLKRYITLKQINFSYPEAHNLTLKNLSLCIPAKTTVGLVGTTGSGKSTTADIIIGLLKPEEGELSIDDQTIGQHNLRDWQRSIGYVPQQIYLADDTLLANIAFGLEKKDIDYAAVERAAKMANLHNFILDELPHGYDTKIGERGVRLSGGQRQRIGIARAIYHMPKVLVLDEATSAMDNVTEKLVMDAVHNLRNEMTIILIAHRLSTVKSCDTIFFLEGGQVTGQGTFNQLVATHDAFRSMVNQN